MLGVDNVSTKEANIALLSTMPESVQQQVFVYLTQNFCNESPYKSKTADEIYAELEKSRTCYENGEYEEFDEALDDISAKYDL